MSVTFFPQQLGAAEFAAADLIPYTLEVTGLAIGDLTLEHSGFNTSTIPHWPEWTSADGLVRVYFNIPAGEWRIENAALSYSARKVSTATTPVGLTGWVIAIGGAGAPIVTGAGVEGPGAPPERIGQWCRAETAVERVYDWYQAVSPDAWSFRFTDGVAFRAVNPPSIIEQDASSRFVTDAEKAGWDAKADATLAEITAILATDPAASRAALEISAFPTIENATKGKIENFHGLMAFMGEIMKLDQSTLAAPRYVGATAFGDSMGALTYTNGMLYQELGEKFGFGAFTSPNLAGFGFNSGTYVWSYTGGASTPSADYTRTPGSNWLVMPAGSTASLPFLNPYTTTARPSNLTGCSYLPASKNYKPVPYGVKKVSVYYEKKSGAGTIEATLSQTQASDQVLSASADATEGMGKLEFTPSDGFRPMTISLAVSGAEVRVIGVLFWSASGGVVPWSSQQGGSSMASQVSALSEGAFKPAYSEFAAELNTSLVLHQQRAFSPVDAAWQANYEAFFDAFALLNAGRVSQLVLGEPPEGTSYNDDVEEINDYLQAESMSRGFAYLNQTQLLGSYAKLAALGWNITTLPSTVDATHLGGMFYRYMAGRIMDECGGFTSALNSFEEPAGQYSRSLDRFRRWASEEQLTRTMHYQTGFVPDGKVESGVGYTVTVDNEKGVKLTGAAVIGHAVCRIGSVSGGSTSGSRANINLPAYDVAIVGRGLRNLSVPANARAWIAIGMHTTAITSVAAIAERCFGLEFAWGPDVGSPDGADSEVVRIFCYDGTSMLYSAWIDTALPGQSATPTTGFGFVLNWNYLNKQLILSTANQSATDIINSLIPRASLLAPLLTTTSNGAQINIGYHATVAPATVGELSWQEITARVGQLGAPYAS